MAGLIVAKKYYGSGCAGFSIPASEHSTITSWTREGEAEAMKNMLEKYPKGIVACVSDSFDIYNACKEYWGTKLKETILAREGCVVVRPDSGELPNIVVDVLNALGEKFECTTTSTGHKLLPPQVRMIQGDGISIESIPLITDAMDKAGWAVDNTAFGSGGALLQKLNRDTMKCAFKCCSITVNGKEIDVFKDPVTDPGKKSKKGKLTVEKGADGVVSTVTEGKGDASKDMLVEVFKDGKLLKDWTFTQVRELAKIDDEQIIV
jgi:nicotinamide phosphoribosyltransferase